MPDAADRPRGDRRIGRDSPMSIAGVGAVTGYGWGTKHMWDGFLLGERSWGGLLTAVVLFSTLSAVAALTLISHIGEYQMSWP